MILFEEDLQRLLDPDSYRESEWRKGNHYIKGGRLYLIKDMETSHLENTIRYFSDLDTTPLQKELDKRNNT